MDSIRTPCIGICSTTSVGDDVCRGCRRYAHEVIQWNAYGDAEKRAVLDRIERLTIQILEERLRIFSVPSLRDGLQRLRLPVDESLSPYCWLHTLLKRAHRDLQRLEDFGVYVRPAHAHLPLAQLLAQMDRELAELSRAHFDRYFRQPSGAGV